MDKLTFHQLLNRRPDSHKYDYGHVLVVGGSPGMVGAPFLSASAALRIGAGLVTVASTADVIDKLEARTVELMTLRLPNDHPSETLEHYIEDRRVSVIVVGPGARPEFARRMLEYLAGCHLPVIVDGGALEAIAEDPDSISNNFILTPHAGEFRRFEGFSDPTKFASSHKVSLVLKGHPTRVFEPGGGVYENKSGGPELATAGTGDVLTGLIAGIIAQKIDPYKAACAAVYIGGVAGNIAAVDKTVPAVIASDVIENLPAALKSTQ